MKVIKVPNSTENIIGTTVFLGGTIDNGTAEKWADDFVEKFTQYNITFLNPRRDNWLSEIEQTIDDPIFREQLEWESYNLENADIIVINILEDSKSVISVAELAEYAAKNKKVVVCCPKGFWRNGNVEFLCEKYNLPLFREIEHIENYIKGIIKL